MHFTYEDSDRLETHVLRQGDVLRRTEGVDALLREIHPHYFGQSEYRYLQVLTQSCDLERRGTGACKARYIALAAVRPLQTVVDREVEKIRRDPVETQAGIADLGQRRTIEMFVERLLNNNESAYFYLHDDVAAGLMTPHCTFLRLSIAVRSGEHYETLVQAKILQLKPEFQAKLGWLTGNLYSRIGTSDWADSEMPDQFKKRTETIVDETTRWVERKLHSKLVAQLKKETGPITSELAGDLIRTMKKPSKKEIAFERVRALLPRIGIEDQQLEKAIRMLDNDAVFSQQLKE